MSTVKDAVLPKVTGALDKLDHLACDGIDSLTHAIPALNTSTPELYQSTRDAAKGYFLWATEYAASFTASQVSLSLADTTLSVAEKFTGFVKPSDKEDQGLASTTYSRIRTLRRTVRSVKRAGAKRNQPAVKPKSLEETGLVGRLASMFYVNTILSVLGLKLAPAATSKETKEKRTGEPLDDSYTSIHDLKVHFYLYKVDSFRNLNNLVFHIFDIFTFTIFYRLGYIYTLLRLFYFCDFHSFDCQMFLNCLYPLSYGLLSCHSKLLIIFDI